ncbi:MAG: hypothetical protein A2428_17570 [Bdellovibrionales bacterium RIFOXYC1_FULL_54_43]|nr:MAG: hypothetical protein A2428_17570 [Bdellovibrionales bacterium RIFOXYC1_FULL_54_43]OFZ83540.1 MAG: hypothetical protein A2603_14875 [Bdellovibrionales bacterium RIFOXYD1_FULL_55_31]
MIRKRNQILRLLFAAVLTAGVLTLAQATYLIPADRVVTWFGNVGVQGDIPIRSTVYSTLSPSGGNDSSAIQGAIDNCSEGQVVKLTEGTFNLNTSIRLKSGVTLRGSGMGRTILKGASGMSGSYVVGITGYWEGGSIGISGGLEKGSTMITTSSSHGWSPGDHIIIDQLNEDDADPPVIAYGNNAAPCRWCGRANGTRSLGQVAKVVAVPSSTTATLEIPLYWNYRASLSPMATRIHGMTKDAGIEDLTVDNQASGSTNQNDNGGTIVLRGASNCWLLRVETVWTWQNTVNLVAAYRNTIRSGKFHDATEYGPGRAYGIRFQLYASANLIENNQIYHVSPGIIANGQTSGNVFSYNYMLELFTTANWQGSGVQYHGAHPIMNLSEGNWIEGRYNSDNTWGSASHNTAFRNRFTLRPSGVSHAFWDVDIQYHSQYFSFLGNVAGTGLENTYELNNVSLHGEKAIYRFGYDGDGDGSASNNDPQVIATALRHGNWDSVTQSTQWNGSADRLLPPSLYLTSKPYWMAPSVSFPPIGPDVVPMYPAAPAMGAGTPFDLGTAATPDPIPITYGVSSSAGPGGSISPSGMTEVKAGASQSFTILPASGFRILNVLIDGVAVGPVTSYTLSNINANHTIKATFVAGSGHTISSSAGVGGIVAPIGTISVASGASQTYRVHAMPGYKILNVYVDNVPVGPVSTYSFNHVVSSHVLSATFASTSRSFTINASAGPGGSIKPLEK